MAEPPRRGALLLNLYTSTNFMAALLRRELEADGVRPEGYGLLTEIQLAGPITPSDLSARTGLPPATIYDYTRDLAQRGEIERVPNSRDGRSYFLTTTERGRETVLRGGLAVGLSCARSSRTPIGRSTSWRPRSPCAAASGFGAVWVTSYGTGYVSRIDPRTNRVVARIRTGGGPAGLQSAFGSVWVGSTVGTAMFRIDPRTNTVVATVKAGPQPTDGVLGPDGLVWIPNTGASTITRIDPATNAVVDTVRSGPGPFVLTVGFGDVWAPSYKGIDVWRLRVAVP